MKSFSIVRILLIPSLLGVTACEQDQGAGLSSNTKQGSTARGSRVSADSKCEQLIASINSSLSLASPLTPFIIEAQDKIKSKLPEEVEVSPNMLSYRENGSGSEHVDFSLYVNDVKLCEYYGKAHLIGGKPFVSGRFPSKKIPFDAIDNLTWGPKSKALENLKKKLKLTEKAKNVEAQKCIQIDGDKATAAYEMAFDVKDLPYYGKASESEVFVAEPSYFNATGTGKAYRKEPIDTANVVIDTFQFNNLSGGGSLCNEKFVVVEPLDTVKAFSTDNVFVYQPTDFRFNQVSVFAHANIHAEWVKALPSSGGVWYGPHIQIELDGSRQGKNNTAVYLPAKSTPHASIRLGQGDNKELRNLHLDSDVVSHELGHHVVYRTLKSTTGESLVIHEGVSDFFVFARTGNPNLGEMICPQTSNVCNSTEHLRSADNKLNYQDVDLPTQGHKRSQLISGMLWDLGKLIGQVKAADIVYKSIDFLNRDAGYFELIVAMMLADKEINSGAHVCSIKNTADARGFDQLLAEVSCENF